MNRERFPGVNDGWARLDGAAGSQVIDSVIEAMSAWMRSGSTANQGGSFKHAHETDELVASTRGACATLLGGEPDGVFFGPSLHRDHDALRGDRRCASCPPATRSSAQASTTTPTFARG